MSVGRFRHSCQVLPLLAAFAFACSDSVVSTTTAPADPHADLIMQRLAELGYRTDMVVDHGVSVLVEGDIVLNKADLLAPDKSSAPTRPSYQWLTDSTVHVTTYYSQELPLNVNFNGLDGASPDWAAALREAISEWSNLSGSGILFVESGPPGNVTVQTYHSNSNDLCGGGSSVVACASLPTTQVMSGYLNINLDFAYTLSAAGKKRNMVHELGHKLGFRHSNWQARGEPSSDANQYGPATDDASVMNGGTALEEWAGFSFYDKWATRYKFTGYGPQPTGWLNGTVANISWAAVTDAVQYQVYYRSYHYGCTHGMCAWLPSDTLLGSTTGGSWADTTHTASSTTTACDGDGFSSANPTGVASYYVKVLFPNAPGTSSVYTYPGNFTCFTI